MISLKKYYVTDGITKSRVTYSASIDIYGNECVFIRAKDWDRSLGKIFKEEYKNNTDSRDDYFEQGRVKLIKSHQLYSLAMNRCI